LWIAVLVVGGESVERSPALDHVGLAEEVGVLLLADQVVDGDAEDLGHLLGDLDGRHHLAALVAADDNAGGPDAASELVLLLLAALAGRSRCRLRG